MQNKHEQTNEPQTSQAINSNWSDAELRRVARVFDLLIKINERIKKGTSNERQKIDPEETKGV
jgi:hypothetical protein